MKLVLSPIRHDQPLRLSRLGDTLIVNDIPFDFSALHLGQTWSAADLGSDWFAGPARRGPEGLELVLALPIRADAPAATCQTQVLQLSGDGPVTLPRGAVKARRARRGSAKQD